MVKIFQRRSQPPIIQAILKEDFDSFAKLIPGSNLDAVHDDLGITARQILTYLGKKHWIQEQKQTQKIVVHKEDEKSLSPIELEKMFGFTFAEQLIFEKYSFLRKAFRLSGRRLRKSMFKRMNQWTLQLLRGDLCTPLDSLKVQWVNPLVGYGIVTTKPMGSYTYIGEYSGVVRKRSGRKDRFNDYVFGYTAGPKDTSMVIDARSLGGITRFLNHSYNPNCTSRWVIIDGLTKIIFFTTKPIPLGEQLTYDYGPYYWRSRSYPLEI